MLSDIVVACCSLLGALGIVGLEGNVSGVWSPETGHCTNPCWPSPVSAEGGIKDNPMVEEVRRNVTASLEVVCGFLSIVSALSTSNRVKLHTPHRAGLGCSA